MKLSVSDDLFLPRNVKMLSNIFKINVRLWRWPIDNRKMLGMSERPQWIFHKSRVWVSVVVLPWFYCDEFSRACQFSWTPFLLSVKTCLTQVYYWVTQVNWRAHYASLASQKLSRSLSWRIINSLIGEFDTNSSWSVRGCEVSRRDHLFWSKLSSNMVRMTVQLWYPPINKMYHPDSINYIKTQRHITFIAPIALGNMILSEN